MHIKRDDIVMVIAGKEKGKTGKVLRVIPKENRAVVEKVNIIKKHVRPNTNNPQGGIIEREAPIHISNLLLLCNSCNNGVRIGRKVLDNGMKVRYCKKCNEILDKEI
jgi:large subunit ribosomal protein L24